LGEVAAWQAFKDGAERRARWWGWARPKYGNSQSTKSHTGGPSIPVYGLIIKDVVLEGPTPGP